MLMSVPSLVFVTPLPNTITNPKRICWNAYGLSVLLPNMTLKLAALSEGFETMCALVIFSLVNNNGLMIGLEFGSPSPQTRCTLCISGRRIHLISMTVFVPIVSLMASEHLHATLVFAFNLYLMRSLMFSEIVCPREFLSTHSTMMSRDSRVLVVSGLMPLKLLS